MPLKFSFITLRAVKNRLPVDDRIQSIGIPFVSRCVCCLQPSAESASHLFLHGTWADSLWSHYQSLFGIDSVRTSLVNWLQVLFSYPHQSMVGCLRRMVPILIISQIGYARNDAVFDQGKFYLQARIRAINRICFSLLIDRRSPKRERPANKRILESFCVQSFAEYEPRLMVVKWLLPPHCFFKLNTDGASRFAPGPAGGGGAVRDHSGSLIFAYACPLGVLSSFYAELLSLFTGLRLCRRLGIPIQFIEMDSLLLVQLLTQQKNIPWRIWHLWSELTLLLGSPSPTVTHIYREANGLADSLANAGCELLSMEVYFMADALPRRSKGIYLLDKAQMPNIRVR